MTYESLQPVVVVPGARQAHRRLLRAPLPRVLQRGAVANRGREARRRVGRGRCLDAERRDREGVRRPGAAERRAGRVESPRSRRPTAKRPDRRGLAPLPRRSSAGLQTEHLRARLGSAKLYDVSGTRRSAAIDRRVERTTARANAIPTGCSGEHWGGGSEHGTGHGELDRFARGRAGGRAAAALSRSRWAHARHRHQCGARRRHRLALRGHERARGERQRRRAACGTSTSTRRLAAVEQRARGERRARGDRLGAGERARGERAADAKAR